MKLAFSTLACPKWDWQHAIEAAKAYGYDGIEWRLIDGEVVTREFPQEHAKAISEAVANAGLETCALDSSVRLALPPGPERDAHIEDALGMLHVARALNTNILRIFPGKYPESATDEEAAGWIVEGLRLLIPTAREVGVRIAIETHDKFDWPRLETRGTTITSFLALVAAQVKDPEFGIQWDIANPVIEGERPEVSWQNIKDNLIYIHLKDIQKKPDGEWGYVPMGEGVLPVSDALGWLQDIGFDGWISYEWEKKWHPELAEPEEVLPHFVTYMKPLIGRA
jgi:sugar phosphate isomerase/epimerase